MQKLIIVQSGDVESSRTLGIFADKERALLFLKAKVKRDFREERYYLKPIYRDRPDVVRLVKVKDTHPDILETWQIDTGIQYWIQARYISINTGQSMTTSWIVIRKSDKFFDIICSTKTKAIAILKTEEDISKFLYQNDIKITVNDCRIINRDTIVKYKHNDYEWIISEEQYFDG